MKIIPGRETEYSEYYNKNMDGFYGQAVIEYSERWAELMEQAIDRGEKLELVAKQLSHEADTDGITGFMYGCAVQGLSQFWLYGEVLRKWHNLDTQISNEGVRANQTGGVLNPAILTIEAPE
jgi:hypothetical protein